MSFYGTTDTLFWTSGPAWQVVAVPHMHASAKVGCPIEEQYKTLTTRPPAMGFFYYFYIGKDSKSSLSPITYGIFNIK